MPKTKTTETTLTIEANIQQLEQIIKELENNEHPLEQHLNQFEKGIELIRHCHLQLYSAQNKIDKLTNTESENQDDTE